MKYKKKSVWAILLVFMLALLLTGCAEEGHAEDGRPGQDAGDAADDSVDPPADAPEDQKDYYGKWLVQKVLAYGVGTYGSDDAEKLVGKSLNFSADEAGALTDDPSDPAAVISSPEYQETAESSGDFQEAYRMSFDALGISADSITKVQITGSDGTVGVFLIKDGDTIIFIAGGTYFELTKQ